jgi:hypothetical protein
MLSPREGPAGWRSVVSTPAAGEIALWQPKRRLAPPARLRKAWLSPSEERTSP